MGRGRAWGGARRVALSGIEWGDYGIIKWHLFPIPEKM